MDLFGMGDGSILQTHDIETCNGGWCCIHNPSDHPLATAPLSWDSSRRVMMRICPCGIYHPDPDHLSFVSMHSVVIAILQGVHDCCKKGCCGGSKY